MFASKQSGILVVSIVVWSFGCGVEELGETADGTFAQPDEATSIGVVESELGDAMNCTNILPSQLPSYTGVVPYGTTTYKLRLPNAQADGKVYCAVEDGIKRPTNILGGMVTKSCATAPRWQVFASGSVNIAICKPNTLRYCSALPGNRVGYLASCMVTLNDFPGEVLLHENVTVAEFDSGVWKMGLPMKTAVSDDRTGHYLISRWTSKYISRKTPTAGQTTPVALYQSGKFWSGISARQIWDLY